MLMFATQQVKETTNDMQTQNKTKVLLQKASYTSG
jgi:hypothetical protein